MKHKKLLYLTLILCLLTGLLPFLAPLSRAGAQTLPPIDPPIQIDPTEVEPAVQVVQGADGIEIEWTLALDALRASAVGASAMTISGDNLPLQTVTVRLPEHNDGTGGNADAPLLQVQMLESVTWAGKIEEAAPLLPPVIDEETGEAQALLPLASKQPTMPTQPAFVLREGRLRGTRLAVIALSPFYSENGVNKLAYHGRLFVPGAELLSDPWTPSSAQSIQAAMSPTQAANPAVDVPQPSKIAARAAVKLHVDAVGMQRVAGAALLASGVPGGAALDQFQLWLRDTGVALQVIDDDGRLDETTELRFYAAATLGNAGVNDIWNATRVYWLTTDGFGTSADVLARRMAVRDVSLETEGVPVRATALVSGVGEDNHLYESIAPGADGDHWFARKLNTNGPPEDYTFSTPFHPTLPLAESDQPGIFQIMGMARTINHHEMQVRMNESETQTLAWINQEFYETWTFTTTATLPSEALELKMTSPDGISEVYIDKVYWQQAARLDFAEGGSAFSGVAGDWRYTLNNLPRNATLYDISDPLAPQILQTAPAAFQDGPNARDYLLVAPGDLHTPALTYHEPVRFRPDAGADAVYIAPAAFRAELAPLVAHRQAQGYRTVVVDVEDIYDAWSGGQVEPEAIRSLLRYAAANWQPAPISAVLVGDSTYDPLDYLGLQNGTENANIIPAYLAEVDDWIGQTACENCYAQLDGASPLDMEADPGFLIDMWVGRFSVQNTEQLATVVDKILRYETAAVTSSERWRQTDLYVADNYIQPNGALDVAGDFTALFDRLIEGDAEHNEPPIQDPKIYSQRVYFDPSPVANKPPWREPDGATTRRRVIERLKAGAGLVAYNGHGNHFQWGTTDRTLEKPYLFGTNDIFELQNMDQLPIVTEMTCYTGQFIRPSASGTTIDERFQRHPDGGAVAVWGSAGLSVAYGQDAMLQGFHQALRQAPPMTARLGELTEAGYLELFTKGRCCQSTRKIYLLFGDPLTPARLWAPDRTFLPLVTGTSE